MKKYRQRMALMLCIALLLPIFSGCSFFGNDAQEEVFDPPYLENYYVNKHEPVCVTGGMEVYRYENKDDILWMGGHAYHGGFVFWPHQTGG